MMKLLSLFKDGFIEKIEKKDGYCTLVSSDQVVPDAKLSKWQWFKVAVNPLRNPYSPFVYPSRRNFKYFYENNLIGNVQFAEEFKNFFLSKVPLKEDSIVLDYGCGHGCAVALLNALGYKNIIAQDNVNFDYWKKMEALFFKNPIGTDDFFPYKDKSFDLITLFEVAMYIEKEELDNFFMNIARILKKGGHVVIEDNNSNSINPQYSSVGFHDNEFLQQIFRKYNLELVELKRYGIIAKKMSYLFGLINQWFMPKKQFRRFQFYSITWMDKFLSKKIPDGQEPLIVFVLKKT